MRAGAGGLCRCVECRSNGRADHNKEVSHLNDSTFHSLARRRGLLTLGILISAIVLLACWGEPGRLWLRYERATLLQPLHAHGGQYWRLLTAHLVHGSWQHALVNIAGLLVMVMLFHGTYRPVQWVVIVALSIAAIDLGFLLLMPQLMWYVGLSGVLHGVLAAGTLAWWRREDWRLATALTAITVGKLAWEQWQGPLPLSGELPVVINAHLFGAIGGLVGGLLYIRALSIPPPPPPSAHKHHP